MNLSIGQQRSATSHWATAHEARRTESTDKRGSGDAAQSFPVQGNSGPSPTLLAHEAIARNYWAVRALETAEVSRTRAAPAGLTEQERYDFYAATPEGQGIVGTEGDLYSANEGTRALFVARVQYLRGEGGPELFDEYTPRRAGLSGEEQADYDAEVEQVMNDLRAQCVYTEGSAAHPTAVPDESLLYVLATQVVEKHGGDPERLEALIGDVNSWLISIDNADGVPAGSGTSAGWYSGNGETATMQLSLEHVVNQLSGPEDYYDILAHELSHSLDISDGSADGVPVGMSEADAQILRDERARLFEIAYLDSELGLGEQHDTADIDSNSNLTDYAFTNEREFWARTSELFLGTDKSRAQLLAASPELYDVMRRYYDRTDLPPSGVETELDDPAVLDNHAGSVFEDIDGELFVDGPSVFDVNQGQVADCYFMAALASLAHTNPDALRDMITDNGDGTYTVHFGGEAGDVTVDDDFAVDSRGRPLYAGTGDAANPELWVAVIEKAYAQAQGSYGSIEYGRANEAIAEITGHDDFTIGAPSAFTPEQIQTAIDEGRSVTASSYSGDKGDKKRTENGIVANHAYVVLGVRESNGVIEVQVYNPWGSTEAGNDGNDDGAFWMSLDDFNASFREVQMMDTPLPEAA